MRRPTPAEISEAQAREAERHAAWATLLAKELANEGKLIEAGWMALRAYAVPRNAPPVQVREMRMAYMAGAQHLFASIMGILDPGEEPTDADLARMDLIAAELDAFGKELKRDRRFDGA